MLGLAKVLNYYLISYSSTLSFAQWEEEVDTLAILVGYSKGQGEIGVVTSLSVDVSNSSPKAYGGRKLIRYCIVGISIKM